MSTVDPRHAGWLLAVGLLAPTVVGLALTVSLFGAIFGLPLLALVAPPWWRSVRILRRKSSFTRASTTWALAAAAGLTALLVGALAIGADDLDSVVDLAAVAVGVGLLAMTWVGALQGRASIRS